MILTVPYVYPMKARMPRQRNDRGFHVRSSVMVRCAAPEESEAPVVMRWHPATPLGGRPDPDGPITEFRQYQGQLYRTIVRREPYGAADRTILTPHAAVAMAADLEDPRNLFLGGAGPWGEFEKRPTAHADPKEEDEVGEMIVSYSGKDRVLAAIHAFAERTLWIGNEVMVRSGEPVYILEEGWGDRPRRGRVRTTDDLGQPHEAEYPAAEQVHRANAIHEVLAAAANGTLDYDPDDPTTFRQLLPDFVEVIDGSMLRYVHDETPRFISRIRSVAEQLWERIREEPIPVLVAWGEMRDAVRKEGVSGQEVADTVRGLIAAVEHCYPSANGRLNWRAENARRELELWEYAPIPEDEPAPSGPAPR